MCTPLPVLLGRKTRRAAARYTHGSDFARLLAGISQSSSYVGQVGMFHDVATLTRVRIPSASERRCVVREPRPTNGYSNSDRTFAALREISLSLRPRRACRGIFFHRFLS